MDKYLKFQASQKSKKKKKKFFHFFAATKEESWFGVSSCSMSGVSSDFQRMFYFLGT
jgi:hypothetical protein